MPNAMGGGGAAPGGMMTFGAGGGPNVATVDFNGLFGRLQRIGSLVNYLNSVRGSTAAALFELITGQYSGQKALLDGAYTRLSRFQRATGDLLTFLQTLAQATTINEVNAAASLPDASLATAINELVAEMAAVGMTVIPTNVAATVTAAPANKGTLNILVSTRTKRGVTVANAFHEAVSATVTADAQPGGKATLGQEPLALAGARAAPDPLSDQWPGGSGAALTIRAVDAGVYQQGGTGNWLYNGDFETWTGPGQQTPDGWAILAGAAGAQIKRSTVPYEDSYALAFVGDGATPTAVYQGFGEQTKVPCPPLTQLAVSLWARVDTLPAAGVLEVALVDAAGNILADAAGTMNSLSVPLRGLAAWGYAPWGSGPWGVPDGLGEWGASGWGGFGWGAAVGTPYVPLGAIFRTPATAPSAVRLRLRLSTPLSAGSTLTIDRVAATAPTPLYAQGPSVAVFSALPPVVQGDTWTIAVRSGRESGTQALFDRLFGMRALGQLLPIGAPAQVPDGFASQSAFAAAAANAFGGGGPGGATPLGGGGVTGGGGTTGLPFGNGGFFNPGPPPLP